mmetsp:Transcript_25134/g.36950  ORF Transcript_25134/g.36950 Transcript_25134/m.36950 type:complete len:580 (-) Transcript_25134:161-1900(-)
MPPTHKMRVSQRVPPNDDTAPVVFKPWNMPTSAAVDIIPVKRAKSPSPAFSPSPKDVLAGTFGEYQLTGSSLGSGGFGSVVEAIDVETGGSLAIKTMERRTQSRDVKIRHEIEIMKWLSDGMAHGRTPMPRSSSEPCLASAAHPLMPRRDSIGSLHGRTADSDSAAKEDGRQLSSSFRPSAAKFFNGHITAIRDCVFTPERVHIVMAAARCNMADHIMAKGRLEEPEARRFFRQLISAVSYCHSMGVCHRDIKLENILVSRDGQTIEIADFGLSKFVDPNTFQCSAVCGTPKYIAPEVILEKFYDGRKSDVWACGVVLFAMLNGRLPFHRFKVRSLKAWTSFVEIAAKMSDARYSALIRAQFVKAASLPRYSSRSYSGRAFATSSSTVRASTDSGSDAADKLLNSDTAVELIQEMMAFRPEDRADTDHISFHTWMHPDEQETEQDSLGCLSQCSSLSDGSVRTKPRGLSGHGSGSLSRTRRAHARDAPAWAPDDSAMACTGCSRTFTVFRRRHHCRRCGQLFCNVCAKKRVLAKLPAAARDFVPVRCPGEVGGLGKSDSVEDTMPRALRVCESCCGTSH